MVGVGLLSLGIALLVPGPWAGPASGFCYFLIGPAQYFVGGLFRLRQDALAGAATAAAPPGPVRAPSIGDAP